MSSAEIVWLASYPKSGNTWLRFLLHAAVHGSIAQSVEVSASIPDVHRAMPTDAGAEARAASGGGYGGRLVMKTHFELSERHPHLDRTWGAVHVIRHPRDVLLSGLNYLRLAGTTPGQLSDRAYAELFIRAGGDPGFAQRGFGTWAGHASSWSAPGFPVHRVRYEDLQADTPGVLRGVLAFLGIEASDEAVAGAVRAGSFDAMRALEVREKNDPKKKSLDKRLFVGDAAGARKGALFMHSGRSGRRLDEAIKGGAGLDDAFEGAFAEAMAQHGYD
ncbi:MAG: sulfotransferase domain-containing protein [Phycisphaerales bacterium JB040]